MTEIFNLLRFDKNQKYISLDFETEGLNLLYSRPWQVGFVLAQGNNILEKYNYFIKWDNIQLSAGAAFITNFNINEYNKVAQNPKEILSIFEDYKTQRSSSCT